MFIHENSVLSDYLFHIQFPSFSFSSFPLFPKCFASFSFFTCLTLFLVLSNTSKFNGTILFPLQRKLMMYMWAWTLEQMAMRQHPSRHHIQQQLQYLLSRSKARQRSSFTRWAQKSVHFPFLAFRSLRSRGMAWKRSGWFAKCLWWLACRATAFIRKAVASVLRSWKRCSAAKSALHLKKRMHTTSLYCFLHFSRNSPSRSWRSRFMMTG